MSWIATGRFSVLKWIRGTPPVIRELSNQGLASWRTVKVRSATIRFTSWASGMAAPKLLYVFRSGGDIRVLQVDRIRQAVKGAGRKERGTPCDSKARRFW